MFHEQLTINLLRFNVWTENRKQTMEHFIADLFNEAEAWNV